MTVSNFVNEQNERDRVKMIEDDFVSLKVELIHVWKKYQNFVVDSSNENWHLFRENLHRIFTSVGVNMDFTLLLQKETHSTPAKLGLADSSLLPPDAPHPTPSHRRFPRRRALNAESSSENAPKPLKAESV